MTGRTRLDATGHQRTDNNPLKGLSVQCPVQPRVRREKPTRRQVQAAREALAVMFGTDDRLPFD
jgi:hypothetical protein